MIWVHDGSFEGLMCAIARVLDAPEGAFTLVPEFAWQPSLLEESCRVPTDPAVAETLATTLKATPPKGFWKTLVLAHLSDRDALDTALATVIRMARTGGGRVLDHHAHPAVRQVLDAARASGGELHRLKGLLRFRELQPGVFWAPCEPEARILMPLALHFRRRMPSVIWAIEDMGRGQTAIWDGHRLTIRETPEAESSRPISAHEDATQTLWKTYFRAVAIPNRRNPRLQRRNMPSRYWRWLVEEPGEARPNPKAPPDQTPETGGGTPAAPPRRTNARN